MSSLKIRKALVKVIGFANVSTKLRVSLYNFCLPHYGFRDTNLESIYIPKDLRFSNSEFMLVWEYNSGKLIRVEKLVDKDSVVIEEIIDKYQESLEYFDVRENQEIEQQYSHLSRDFFIRIVGIDYKYEIVSDKSYLDYFAIAYGTSLENYQEKIKSYYNVDVSKLINSPFIEIIKKIDFKSYRN